MPIIAGRLHANFICVHLPERVHHFYVRFFSNRSMTHKQVNNHTMKGTFYVDTGWHLISLGT